MKRTKFIAGALVLSMGLLGTGYAYWTDTLTIETNVSTAQMGVNFMPLYKTEGENPQDVYYQINHNGNTEWLNKPDDVNENGVEPEDSIKVDSESMNWNVSNLYPGVDVTVTTKIKNISTIPVRIIPNVENNAAIDGGIIFTVNGTKCTDLNLQSVIEDKVKELDQPGEELDLVITTSVAGKEATKGEEQSKKLSLKLDFKVEQFNQPVEGSTGN